MESKNLVMDLLTGHTDNKFLEKIYNELEQLSEENKRLHEFATIAKGTIKYQAEKLAEAESKIASLERCLEVYKKLNKKDDLEIVIETINNCIKEIKNDMFNPNNENDYLYDSIFDVLEKLKKSIKTGEYDV
jgi:predicted  nucleic acid-binding Zn-ribbon protein